MTLPTEPAKLDSEPVATPEGSRAYFAPDRVGDDEAIPQAVVLCYSRGIFEYLTETYSGDTWDGYFGELYVFDDADRQVGVAGRFGIGAPTAAMVMEDLIADGVEAFLSIGYAGCLQPDIEPGTFVVPEAAIRDEGTSYHYAPARVPAEPTQTVATRLTDWLDREGIRFHTGRTWTIDAIYRETETEVEQYAEDGVLTVEMEASAVFTVARHHGVEAASLLVVSDYLSPGGWEPQFFEIEEETEALAETAVEVLIDYVG